MFLTGFIGEVESFRFYIVNYIVLYEFVEIAFVEVGGAFKLQGFEEQSRVYFYWFWRLDIILVLKLLKQNPRTTQVIVDLMVVYVPIGLEMGLIWGSTQRIGPAELVLIGIAEPLVKDLGQFTLLRSVAVRGIMVDETLFEGVMQGGEFFLTLF